MALFAIGELSPHLNEFSSEVSSFDEVCESFGACLSNPSDDVEAAVDGGTEVGTCTWTYFEEKFSLRNK